MKVKITSKIKPDDKWQSGEDVMMWWVGDDPRQIRFDKPEYLK